MSQQVNENYVVPQDAQPRITTAEVDELAGDFVPLCETSRLDPKEGLSIPNAQDWRQEEVFTMQAFTIHEDFV
jgi:hypothetical protein